jgi:oxygen-independent coproporphyrinogen-3 oxidase
MSAVEHVYIHVPFCTHICPYCGFHKHKNHPGLIRGFLPALRAEIAAAVTGHEIRPRTIFFGGGTPSALSTSQLRELFEQWPWSGVGEFTMECNPETLTETKAAVLRGAGVNRISLGVQSLDPHFLRLLGRTHTPESVERTVRLLRRAGIDNISIDLMFGLPGQTLAQWIETVRRALDLGPEHLSAYNLTFEEDTDFLRRFEAGEWTADEHLHREMFLATGEEAAKAGLELYEVSNFARPGFESVHNRAYWQGRDFLGFGPSAVSTVGGVRWKNIAHTGLYNETALRPEGPVRDAEQVDGPVREVERIMLGLRTREGVPLAWLEGVPESRLDELETEGLARRDGNRFRLTLKGLAVADSITELLT